MTIVEDLRLPATGRDFGLAPHDIDAGAGETIRVESASLLFRGEYAREGADLIISGGGERLVVHHYFDGDHRPRLVAPNGAFLSDAVIDALAGPAHAVQVAQAGGAPATDAQSAIGRVQTTTGTASVVRNGVTVALHVGDLVYKGDVVQTDSASSISVSFLDGTLFSLGGSARMVLSDMVYQANGSDNHSLFNLVQGSISFVAGKVAKTGDMKVGTPVATMGIRGTFVGADIGADDGTTRLSVRSEPATPEHPNGYTGSFGVYDPNNPTRLLFTVSDPQLAYVVHPDGSGGVRYESVQKTPQELAVEAQLTQTVFKILSETPRLPVFNGPSSRGGASSGDEPSQILPNPTPGAPGSNTPGQPLPGLPGSSGPTQLPPDTRPMQDRDSGADMPPLVFLPPGATTATLLLTARSAAVAQDGLRDGLGEQGVLAGVGTEARIVAARAGSSADRALIDGTATLDGQYGTLMVRVDGTYSYRADRAASLAQGQHGSDVFSLTAQSAGASATTTLTIDVTGINDAPVLAADASGAAGNGAETGGRHALTETPGSTASAAAIQAGGTLAFTDVDLTDTHTFARSAPVFAWSAGALNQAQTAALVSAGVLSIVGTDSTGTGSGSVSFSYAAANRTFDFLAAGETLTITYEVTITDNHGATSARPVVFTVTGTNDAPVVTGAVTGVATKDGMRVALDALANASDVDHGAELSVVNVPGTLPAGVTYDAATHSFALDPADSAYQRLAAGQATTVSVAYGVSDGIATTAASVSWIVTGANRGPVVTGPVIGTATEDGAVSRLDALANASDVDDGAQLSVVNVPAALPAGVTYDSAAHSFALDPANEAYQYLAAAQTTTVSVAYGVSDGTATTPASVSWTVTGTNDVPVLASATGLSVLEQSDRTGSGSLDTATGQVRFTDPDVSDRHTATVGAPSGLSRSSGTALPAGLAASLASALGTSVDENARALAYTFSAPDRTFDFLGAGETLNVTYTLTLSDGQGGSAQAPVTVAVTGSNDAPVLAGAPGLSVGEQADRTGSSSADTASGRVSFSDPDTTDSHTVTVGAPSGLTRSSGTALPTGLAANLASALTAGVDASARTIGYTFSAADRTFDFLGAGETLNVTYTLTLSDGQGSSAQTPVAVTVTGSNDAPVLDAAPGLSVGEQANRTGSSSADTASGRIGFSDADTTDTHTVAASEPTSVSRSSGAALPEGLAASLASALGASVDESTRAIDYSFSAPDKTFDFLAAGETLRVTYDLILSDGHGGTARTTVAVTVTGTDDAPVLTLSQETATYRGNGQPVAVNPGLTLTDLDGPNLTGAVVSIGSGFDATQDLLSVTAMSGITGSYDAASGRLTLSGSASAAQYQEVLRTVSYANGSSMPTTADRAISFSITPSTFRYNPDNGHFYQSIAAPDISWAAAKAAADAATLYGLHGYLATFTSASENAYARKTGSVLWFGASDDPSQGTSEGNWVWADGPEKGQVFYRGRSGTGSTVSGQYSNWASGEPNNSDADENFGAVEADGRWNDLSGRDRNTINGYVIEYGGLAGDPVVHLAGTSIVKIQPFNRPPTAGGDRTISVTSGGSVVLTSADLRASDPDTPNGPFTYAITQVAHGSFTNGNDIVTAFTQADIDAGRVVYHRDDSFDGHASDTVAFTVSDGAGGSTTSSLSVNVVGPYTRQDNVVRPSDDAQGNLSIPNEALLFNDLGTRPLQVTGVRDQSGSGTPYVSGTSPITVTVTEAAASHGDTGTFTYAAQNAEGTGNAARVFVNVSTAPSSETPSVATGAAQDDDVLFASRDRATVLNGSDSELSHGAEQTGRDVFVFTQDPGRAESHPVHSIVGFSTLNDAIDLPFLHDTGADTGTIGDYVRIVGSESDGYGLLVRSDTAFDFAEIARFDAGSLPADGSVTVIWSGHAGSVGLTPEGEAPVGQNDHVVRASNDGSGDLAIPTEALLFNDYGTAPLGATNVSDQGPPGRPYVSQTSPPSATAVTVTQDATSPAEDAFTAFRYTAKDPSGRTGDPATVTVEIAVASEDAAQSVASGSGQNDDILFASRIDATVLNGNVNGTSGGERTGHDVFVFTQASTGRNAAVFHSIVDFSAENDAIDLPFLNGTEASEDTIDRYVRLIGDGESGYSLIVNTSGGLNGDSGDTRTLAHFAGSSLSHQDTVTVIWHDHQAHLLVPAPILA